MRGVFVVAFFLAVSPAAAQDANLVISDIMRSRNVAECKNLAPRFLHSRLGFHDPGVRELAARCYTSKARLHLFGEQQHLITNGTRISELPARVLAEQTGLQLDVYAPLIGKQLRE